VIGNSHKGETLYRWGKTPDYVWKVFGEKDTHPKYQGDVKNGKPDGLGVLIYPFWGKYVGEWKNGEQNGQGIETLYDGRKYEGEYKYGNRNGQGISTFPNGMKKIGKWKNGIFSKGIIYNKNIIKKYSLEK
jgi:hypothetical protein